MDLDQIEPQGARSIDEMIGMRAPWTYLIRVQGDSMTGAGISDGDILVVSKLLEPKAGSVIIGVVNGEAACKRLDYVSGMPVLRSQAKGYQHRYILESDRFEVWGVVTHSLKHHGV